MKYINYLKNKNLSKNTINSYLLQSKKWNEYLDKRNPNKTIFIKYLQKIKSNYSASSIKLIYSSLISYFKFEKRWKLIEQCRDIKLPQIQQTNRTIVKLEEFNYVKSIICFENEKNWKKKRNWLIFSFLFLTGIRISEIGKINKKNIYENNRIKIVGKGEKERVIYLTDYLLELLLKWKSNQIAINRKNKILSKKQLVKIIKTIGIEYFQKEITPHSLRRSFATNMLKKGANIEIIRKTLGHSSINTTARYLQFTEDDIIEEMNKLLN